MSRFLRRPDVFLVEDYGDDLKSAGEMTAWLFFFALASAVGGISFWGEGILAFLLAAMLLSAAVLFGWGAYLSLSAWLRLRKRMQR